MPRLKRRCDYSPFELVCTASIPLLKGQDGQLSPLSWNLFDAQKGFRQGHQTKDDTGESYPPLVYAVLVPTGKHLNNRAGSTGTQYHIAIYPFAYVIHVNNYVH